LPDVPKMWRRSALSAYAVTEFAAFTTGLRSPVPHLNYRGEMGGGTTRVDVTDRPLEISLQLHRGVDLSGTVEVERNDNNQIAAPQP